MAYIDDDETDELYDSGIGELEQRASLERIRADGVQVEVDLAEDTSLRRYVNSRRLAAIDALAELVAADPRDAVEISRLQHIATEYLNVRSWARGEIEQSHTAEETLQRDYRGQISDEA